MDDAEHQTTTSRRSLLKRGAAVGAAGVAGAVLPGATRDLIAEAASTAPAGASLKDVEHVVFVMQENRSFDSYFGTLSGVRGFSDPKVLSRKVNGVSHKVFDQFGYRPGTGADPNGYLQPFELASRPPQANGQCTNDITHSWGPQHQSWNNGAMDQFVAAHIAAEGAKDGPVTMGYFTRADLPFYHALADAFTVLDGYHCSVLGPTDPNRLMAISGTIDPDGAHGGPVVETFGNRFAETGQLTWETMPERLLAAGVPWKVYNGALGLIGLSPLPYFRSYGDLLSATGRTLASKAFAPRYPADFAADVKANTLPSVSWITPPLAECEHPAAPPAWGEYFVSEVLRILVSNPEVWAKTVLITTYDENGGFFDHVPPPTAPAGTPGEYLTPSVLPKAAGAVRGPVGLGFRVPTMVISPWSSGGYVCSTTFDHTSQLLLLEKRFGVPAPNISAWRRKTVGDLTQPLRFASPAKTTVPPLPPTTLTGDVSVVEQAVLNALTGTLHVGVSYPLPTANAMPAQETTPVRKRV